MSKLIVTVQSDARGNQAVVLNKDCAIAEQVNKAVYGENRRIPLAPEDEIVLNKAIAIESINVDFICSGYQASEDGEPHLVGRDGNCLEMVIKKSELQNQGFYELRFYVDEYGWKKLSPFVGLSKAKIIYHFPKGDKNILKSVGKCEVIGCDPEQFDRFENNDERVFITIRNLRNRGDIYGDSMFFADSVSLETKEGWGYLRAGKYYEHPWTGNMTGRRFP